MATPQTPPTTNQTSMALTPLDRQVLNIRHRLTELGIPKKIEASLPQGIEPTRFFNVAMTELRRNPDLLACEPNSIAGAIVQAAQVGLELDRNLGQAWLIPYKQEGRAFCELQYGYRGLIQLAWRTGLVKSLNATVVRDGERFAYEKGTDPYLRHVPDDECEENPITHAYAVVQYTNGGIDFEVLTRKAIDKRRARSKAPNSPAWKNDYESMAKTKPLTSLIKRMPVSAENEALVKAAYLTELADSPDVSQNNGAIIEAQPANAEAVTRSSTQDHRAAAATQSKATNLADLHATESESTRTAVSADPQQGSEESPFPPSDEPPGPSQEQEQIRQQQEQPLSAEEAAEKVINHQRAVNHRPPITTHSAPPGRSQHGMPLDFNEQRGGRGRGGYE